MMESPVIPPVLETTLLPGTYRVGPRGFVNTKLTTISSSVPMKYDRRVQFSEPGKQASSNISLNSENTDITQLTDSEEEAMRFKYTPKVRPLAQIEPLSVTSLHHRQALVKMRPRIEIRLRRPRSLHDVSGEMAANDQTDHEINGAKEGERSPKPAPSSPGRFNRWPFAKKLTRFASSPNLVCPDTDKSKVDDDASLSRSRTSSGSSFDSCESPSETRRAGSDFLSRFRRRKAKGRNKGKPLRIEIFKRQENGKSQTHGKELQSNENNETKTVDVEKGVNPTTSNEVPLPDNSKAPITEDTSAVASTCVDDVPSNNGRIRVHLMFHFTSQLPCEGSTKTYDVVKDATHALPLKDGETLITDILSNKMVLFDSQGRPKVSFIFDEASEPWGSCLTSDGTLAVTLRRHGCVSLWSLSGLPLSEFGHDVLVAPTGIQVDSSDRFVVTDEKSNSVCIFNKEGQFLQTFLQPQTLVPSSSSSTSNDQFRFDHPRYVCVTADGHYVIADSANHCVKVFDPDGNFCNRIGSFGQKDGKFRFPYGVACDNVGFIYVADHFNHRISVFSIDGAFQYHALTHQDGISRPKGLAIQNIHLYVTYGSLRAGRIGVFNLSSRRISFTATV